MRCPKCHYLGFEPEPRCKNCGYDFSFSEPMGMDVGDETLDGADTVERVEETAMPDPRELEALEEAAPVVSPTSARGSLADFVASERVQSAHADFDLHDLDLGAPAAGGRSIIPASPDFAFDRFDLDSEPTPAPHRAHASVTAGAAAGVAVADPIAASAAVAEPRPEPRPEPRATVTPVPVQATVPLPTPRDAPKPVAARMAAPATTELPLFMHGVPDAAAAPGRLDADDSHAADDEPLVKMPAAPRAPLSVRRATPDAARLRALYGKSDREAIASPAALDLLGSLEADPVPAVVDPPEPAAAEPPVEDRVSLLEHVSAGQRLAAAGVDGALVIVLNIAIVWFTLDVCQLPATQLLALPLLPLAAFLTLLDTGYLVLFTAACGQTIGKMAAGIRVVGTSAAAIITDEVSIGQATARALGTLLSILPLGLGFWMGLIGQGRSLHDRLAHTRVVRA